MLVGWIDLIRRPFTKRTDFVSVDARGYSNNPKNYELITSPPTTSTIPKTPDPALTRSPRDHDAQSPAAAAAQSPPSPSSQYTNDYYFNKEPGSKNRQLSFSLPHDADYKSPKLSFSTPRPPSAGRSFSRDSYGRSYQPQHGGTSPGRALSPPTGRESTSSTFSSAYDWDPTTTYAPPSMQTPSYSRPGAYDR